MIKLYLFFIYILYFIFFFLQLCNVFILLVLSRFSFISVHLTVCSLEVTMYFSHYTAWDQNICPLNRLSIKGGFTVLTFYYFIVNIITCLHFLKCIFIYIIYKHIKKKKLTKHIKYHNFT